ncbi:MAG: CDGSH iron-sulfur domain-containing protein [Proteobacteria bacterium]|nr:CDGSH iron-sulfur domain-containing protein [Pseudomonadota bacterium]
MSNPKCTAKSPAEIELEPDTYYWCSCGATQNDPFCDGAHRDTDMHPVSFTIDTKETVALCRCRETKTPPYCDGSHKEL